MPPEHAPVFGGGAAETTVHPAILVITLLAVILILVLPRKYLIMPLFCSAFLVPVGQVFVIAGLHFPVARLVILVGLVRMCWATVSTQTSIFAGGLNAIDHAFLWAAACEGIAVTLLFMQTDAMINEAGSLCDVLGGYILLRFLIQNEDDIYRFIKCLAFISLIIAIGMLIEQWQMFNIFGLLGGIHLVPTVRDGRIRSAGTFAHELLAGTFGATSVPVFLFLWKKGDAKLMAAVGVIAATIITWTSNSSTALLAFAAGILALCFWPLRGSMRLVRWGFVFGLLLLALVMKAPVWFVIAHVDLTGSSSSYQRAELVDQFIRHFGDWWLLGTKSAGSWGWDMWDAQNQYVSVGERGGLAALIFFIAMISCAFSRLGNARKAIMGDRQKEWILWLLGSALFAHLMGFFGVNYFDQSRLSWFALLASISVATTPILQAIPSREGKAEGFSGRSKAPLVPSSAMRERFPHRHDRQVPSRNPRHVEP